MKNVIMAAIGLALASVVATGANAAPVMSGAGTGEAATALVQKAHYEGRHHHRSSHRNWRPRMFGYLRNRHYHHNHGHQHHHNHGHQHHHRHHNH